MKSNNENAIQLCAAFKGTPKTTLKKQKNSYQANIN